MNESDDSIDKIRTLLRDEGFGIYFVLLKQNHFFFPQELAVHVEQTDMQLDPARQIIYGIHRKQASSLSPTLTLEITHQYNALIPYDAIEHCERIDPGYWNMPSIDSLLGI